LGVAHFRWSLSDLPLPVSRLGGEDGDVLEFNAVAQVDAVFDYDGSVWLLKMDVALLFLDPGFDRMASLLDLDLTAFSGHAVHTRCLESQVFLHRLKEAGDPLRGRPTDLMCLDSSVLIQLKRAPAPHSSGATRQICCD
jgi:hypothetical protein